MSLELEKMKLKPCKSCAMKGADHGYKSCPMSNLCSLVLFNKMSPQYISKIFHPCYSRYNTCMTTLKLDLPPPPPVPLRHSCLGQKKISYLGLKTWSNRLTKIKLSRNVNTFKHDIELQKQNDDIFLYYYLKIPT